MHPRTRNILLLAGTGLLIGLCIFGAPFILPSIAVEAKDTPTPTASIPTDTPTLPAPGQGLVDATSTAPITINTAVVMPTALAVPSPFDITLYFTNSTCGGPAGENYSYTVSIELVALTLQQIDANITTAGDYDPASGAFNTSADVGPGVETYTGVIAYDGQTILMSGVYGWNPDSGSPCGADFSGETTP
ncbi:MAG: hypothetical protein ACOYZ8_06400 [Chloroflexota bacterium]